MKRDPQAVEYAKQCRDLLTQYIDGKITERQWREGLELLEAAARALRERSERGEEKKPAVTYKTAETKPTGRDLACGRDD